VICWLSPDGVREGICRIARLLEDCIDGEFSAGCGGGVSCAGESCGDSSELMSMAPPLPLVFSFHKAVPIDTHF
jgi:hypothetical protein